MRVSAGEGELSPGQGELLAEREGLPSLHSGQANMARVARLIGLVANAPAAFKPFPPLRFGRGSHPSRSVVNFP